MKPVIRSAFPRYYQLLMCFALLFGIYMLLAILDNDEADLISEIGILVIQPIIASALIAITMLICYLAGLPLRLISRLSKWWLRRQLISLSGIIGGLLCFIIAFNAQLMDKKEVIIDGAQQLKQVPNFNLSVIGWFMVGFFSLHFYPGRLVFHKTDD